MKIQAYNSQRDHANVNAAMPKQAIHTNAQMFGAGQAIMAKQVSDSLDKGANALKKAAIIQKKAEIELEEKRATAWSAENAGRLSEWFNDPETGIYKDILTRKGEGALGLTKESSKTIDARIQEMIASAPNERAREKITAKAQGLRNDFMRLISRHESKELASWELQSMQFELESDMKRIVNTAVSMAPGEIDASIEGLDEKIQAVADRTGKPYEVVKAAFGAKVKDLIIDDAIANKRLGMADGLLKRWRDDLDVADRVSGRKALGTAKTKRDKIRNTQYDIDAEEQAGHLIELIEFDAGATLPEGKVRESEVRALIRDIKKKDPKYGKKLSSAFKSQLALTKLQHVEAKRAGSEIVTDALEDRENDPVAAQKYVDELPEGSVVERAVKKVAEGKLKTILKAQGIDFKSDAAAYVEVVEKIGNAEITDPRDIDQKYPGAFTASDRKELKKSLAGKQKVTDKRLKEAFTEVVGVGRVKDMSTSQKNAMYEYMRDMREIVRENNKGEDAAYLRSTAADYMSKGQTDPNAIYFTGDTAFRKVVKGLKTAKPGSDKYNEAKKEWSAYLPTLDRISSEDEAEIDEFLSSSKTDRYGNTPRDIVVKAVKEKGYEGTPGEVEEYAKRMLYKQIQARRNKLPPVFTAK